MDADDGYIFPDADTEYISTSDVKKLSDSELQYAVNEIYARHGLKFTKKSNKERFEKKAWYNGTVDDQDSISLNKYEKKNVDTMAAELKKRGLR
ncbi:MAG: YARHG domain-containing protein [Anaerostipes hadrus]